MLKQGLFYPTSNTRLLVLGQAATDFSPTGKTVSVSGATTSSSSPAPTINGSRSFNGTSAYLSLADHADFTLGSGNWWTETLFKRGATGRMTLWGQTDSGFNNSATSICLTVDVGDFIRGSALVSTTDSSVSTTANTNTTNWQHAIFQRNSGNVELYLNGSFIGQAAISGTINNSANQFAIGRPGERADTYWYNGLIALVRIEAGGYLTANQVANRYNKLKGGF